MSGPSEAVWPPVFAGGRVGVETSSYANIQNGGPCIASSIRSLVPVSAEPSGHLPLQRHGSIFSSPSSDSTVWPPSWHVVEVSRVPANVTTEKEENCAFNCAASHLHDS